jgi:hypothetical protein
MNEHGRNAKRSSEPAGELANPRRRVEIYEDR